MTDVLSIPIEELTRNRTPDFEQLLKVLRNEVPDRPVLFEMAANVSAVREALGNEWLSDDEHLGGPRNYMNAHRILGYDYSVVPSWPYQLATGGKEGRAKQEGEKSKSLNEEAPIKDEETFENFDWPVHHEGEYARMAELGKYVPDGMKLLMRGGSMEEGIINLVGYDNLCFMMFDQPDLIQAIADRLGEFVVEHYTFSLQHDFIGVALHSDDWGFKTQTLMPPDFLRQYIIPWHKKITECVHSLGRPMILHSCGKLEEVMDDVIDDCRYDAKHSFEDEIIPIEEYYEKWHDRIPLLGGIDVDFLSRKKPEEIYDRSKAMIERTKGRGGYALGSGNSIPDYIPRENYFAMLKAGLL